MGAREDQGDRGGKELYLLNYILPSAANERVRPEIQDFLRLCSSPECVPVESTAKAFPMCGTFRPSC